MISKTSNGANNANSSVTTNNNNNNAKIKKYHLIKASDANNTTTPNLKVFKIFVSKKIILEFPFRISKQLHMKLKVLILSLDPLMIKKIDYLFDIKLKILEFE